jgi:hypothetical protein
MFLILFIVLATIIVTDSISHFNWLMEIETDPNHQEIGSFIIVWTVLPALGIICLYSLYRIWHETLLMIKHESKAG